MKKNWILVLAILLLVVGIILYFSDQKVLMINDFALEYFAAGNFACGVFSAGIFSVGIFSVGIFSIGIFSLSIFNISLYGLGIFIFAYRKKDLTSLTNQN